MPGLQDSIIRLSGRIACHGPISLNCMVGPCKVVLVDRAAVEDDSVGDAGLTKPPAPLRQLWLPVVVPDDVGLHEREPFAGLFLEPFGKIQVCVEPADRVVVDRLYITELDAWKRSLQDLNLGRDITY